jgi:Family of unknown function (DUF5681)
MSDQPLGYKKPPPQHRFKPGVSGNPSGRPKRSTTDLASIIVDVLSAPIEYQDGGKLKTASARDLNVMMLVKRAVNGDVDAALALLRTRDQAEQRGSAETEQIEVFDWTPDFPGQTAEQKTQAYLNKKSATSVEWWAEAATSEPEPNRNRKDTP